MNHEQELIELNKQINYKFIREMPKPLYKAKTPIQSFTIPTYSQMNKNSMLSDDNNPVMNRIPTIHKKKKYYTQSPELITEKPPSNNHYYSMDGSRPFDNYTKNDTIVIMESDKENPSSSIPSLSTSATSSSSIHPTQYNNNNHCLVLNCRSIHSHILSCPVCTKLYKCQNNNGFYAVIVVLIIAILVLLKFVLNRNKI